MSQRAMGWTIMAAALVVVVCLWVLSSHYEALAYNRLTGGSATTWDAMVLELRVIGSEP